MRRDPENDEYDAPPRRRETIMERRIRKARGEDVDDRLDTDDDYDDPYERRPYRQPPLGGYAAPMSGGGCATTMLYLVVGFLGALLLIFFFFNNTFSGIGSLFSGTLPQVQRILVTPTPTVRTGAAVIQSIRQLNRLETTSFTIERVIDVNQGSSIPFVGDFLAGDRLLLIAHGTIIAGIDLSKLEATNVNVSPDGTAVTLKLPPVEVLSNALDNSRTRVYDRQRGLFAPANTELETQARQVAEKELMAAACEGGLMQQATDKARVAVEQLLRVLDFQQILVITAPVPECPAKG